MTDVYIPPLKWTLLQLLVFHEMNEEDIAFLNEVSEPFRVTLNAFSFPIYDNCIREYLLHQGIFAPLLLLFFFLNDNLCTHYNASNKLLERPVVIRNVSLI